MGRTTLSRPPVVEESKTGPICRVCGDAFGQILYLLMDKRLEQVRHAYNLTVEQHRRGVDSLKDVPENIKRSAFYLAFSSGQSHSNSASSDILDYLKPRPSMRFLDVGCSANLVNYRLDLWPSTYYGIDISPALVQAVKSFAAARKLRLGGLYVAEAAKLPFKDRFFDIAAAIGVLEYCSLPYCRRALSELAKVLKPESRVVIDIPNREHRHARDMARLESFLGRPIYLHIRSNFEIALKPFFSAESIDDSAAMIRYFLRLR